MFSMIMVSSFLSLSLSLLMCPTPLSLALWVLLLALTASITITQFMYSWFGLMLFLIYVGGMLVMFAYFLAIQPNQQMELMKPLLVLLLSFCLIISIYTPKLSFITSNTYWMTPMIGGPSIPIMILLALALFLALLMVVKITSLSSGPLRPFN